jgi:DNA-binding CsgD family transcriptional regulator
MRKDKRPIPAVGGAGVTRYLERGRAQYQAHAWTDAYRLLSLAERSAALLAGEDLERLATSAYLIGRESEFHRCLERAHHAHLTSGDPSRAARCAFWLCITLLLRGDSGQSNGWLARAQRLVEGRDTVERGYLLVPLFERQFHRGQVDIAQATATSALQVGERFGDADLTACARHQLGRLLLAREQISPGLALLDDAMLAAARGELSPIMTGLLYCSVISACTQVYALAHASEWTEALAQWCDEQPDMIAFTGACLVHRAEIMQLRGAWSHAMAEAERASERISRFGGTRPPTNALYCKAELHRLRGELAEAEAAYEHANRAGSEPQPGFALLRLDQGRVDAAAVAIRRVVGTTTDRLQRAGLLPAYVEIMLASGDIDEARHACDELMGLAATLDSELLDAVAAYAHGTVQLAQGDARSALNPLRRAFELWQRIDAPYEIARTRLLMGQACRALGDEEASRLEFDEARSLFERLGAAPQIARLDASAGCRAAEKRHPLTDRELQVLRLVVAGNTNKSIAHELFLSERTIDRHVSNIYTKLGVSSRAAATAYAYAHQLL